MAMTTTAMPGFVPMALPPGLPQEAYGQGNTAEWLESWYAAWTMMSHGMRLQASPGGSDDPLRESSSGSLSEGEAGGANEGPGTAQGALHLLWRREEEDEAACWRAREEDAADLGALSHPQGQRGPARPRPSGAQPRGALAGEALAQGPAPGGRRPCFSRLHPRRARTEAVPAMPRDSC
eukprot:CAMPEP_0168390448 /NCGR_PEP_ID=MMETSP0228-20121227/17480_1 /TAXON_ID=133427 /ORGANISM="Protoceratium reticulatum, Strain CCCM 535 (=CCMP 1889)" /LENGTH=178 /DNA_ID=CAMNT_0008403743 /DNA_START=67 /DNA_END=599 /DNA_ORIENTATION=+